MRELPHFKRHPLDQVLVLVNDILSHGTASMVKDLTEFPDGHYRVWFGKDYFILPTGVTEPSKSQWNTLKKKFKRRDKRVFVFKEHGTERDLYYLDFGFMGDMPPPRR